MRLIHSFRKKSPSDSGEITKKVRDRKIDKIVSILLGTAFTLFCCFLFGDREAAPTIASSPGAGTPLPIVMYHNVCKDGAKTGDYTVTVSQLEEDLAFLQEKGYNAVVGLDLVQAVQGVKALPENPVFLTFDDGHESFYTNVLPLLEKYNMKATVNIVGSFTDLFSGSVPKEESYAHLSWNQLRELKKSPLVEIGNHTYDLHELKGQDGRKGSKKRNNETFEEYQKVLSDDVLMLQTKMNENLYDCARVFAYPYGFYTQESEKILPELGFDVTLTCEEGINLITESKDCLKAMKRYNRPGSAETEVFFAKLGL